MKRPVLVSIFLVVAMAVSFLLPKPHYTSANVLSLLKVPAEFAGWKSQDVSKIINMGEDGKKFISDIFARLYQDRKGRQLMLLILDAGNFHNPKVCYGSSGFAVKELDAVDFTVGNVSVKANTLLLQRQKSNLVMFYWLCIDKKMVNWSEQKFLELWYSLTNTKKAGLMIRLDVPATGITPQECAKTAGDFIRALNHSLSIANSEYLFGK
jgi:EpsI family protein